MIIRIATTLAIDNFMTTDDISQFDNYMLSLATNTKECYTTPHKVSGMIDKTLSNTSATWHILLLRIIALEWRIYNR